MEEINFAVFGDPKSLKRHRTYKTNNGLNINVDPSKDEKKTFLWKAIAANKPIKPFSTAIKVKIMFYMPRPKSHYGTGKNSGTLKKNAPTFHIKKPDIDNLVKFVLDALNGAYWVDDTIVSTLMCRKIYTDGTPKTIINIKRDSLVRK